jgi:hypothetical protein
MDFARQEARAEVSPSRASPPQLPPSPKIRPLARRQSQAEEERGEGGVRREPGERGENDRRSPGSQLGFAYQTGANGPSGSGRPFLARIKQTPILFRHDVAPDLTHRPALQILFFRKMHCSFSTAPKRRSPRVHVQT